MFKKQLEERKIKSTQSKPNQNQIKVIRLKNRSTDTKPGRILLECKNKEQKTDILKAAKNLKSQEKIKHIFINNELTSAQVEQEKKLTLDRNERNSKLSEIGRNNFKYGVYKFGQDLNDSKFFWGIRNGDLGRIKVIS